MISNILKKKYTGSYQAQLKALNEELREADTVLIGVGAGLSTSAGFSYSGERFERSFGDFIEKYHISDMYAGGFYPWKSLEEYWAWWSSREMRIPTELIPRCPVCGKPMAMNLRCDSTFVHDEGWYEAEGRYEAFLQEHKGKKILFLELGVGGNTPVIVRLPSEKMMREKKGYRLIRLNLTEAFVLERLGARAVGINADIAKSIADMKKAAETEK